MCSDAQLTTEQRRQRDVVRCDIAAELREALPNGVRGRLRAFREVRDPAGALLLRGLPVGELPPTPADPRDGDAAGHTATVRVLTLASVLGEPVGYQPEHDGDVVQNIVPVRASADRQTSTSSAVDLMFHTEAAFHPHRPHFVLLFCLRGDPQAETTIASIDDAIGELDADVIDTLFEPRFRCAIDESYLHGRTNVLGPPRPVLSGDRAHPVMVFDEDLMVGVDEQADAALRLLGQALIAHRNSITLTPGDLLVIDNHTVVHGRSVFEPRLDGTDRWLLRSFVVDDLADSDGERDGRTITTVFGV